MISRVAEACFWLHRYVERLEDTARFLDVNRAFVLDAGLPTRESWRPVVVVAGEEANFIELHGENGLSDGELIQEYMTWSAENLVSIHSSTYWARENARTIREVISLEMWNTLNSFWVWLESSEGRDQWESERSAFYARCVEMAQLFRGICADGVLHEEPFDFMRLGMLIERGGQTARILDVKFHTLGATRPDRPESTLAYAQWAAILRSCAGTESFLKRGHSFSGDAVANFLMFDPDFPRSIRHCVERSWNFLQRIRIPEQPDLGARSAEILHMLRDEVSTATVESIRAAGGSHQALTHYIDCLARFGTALHDEYFDPVESSAAVNSQNQ